MIWYRLSAKISNYILMFKLTKQLDFLKMKMQSKINKQKKKNKRLTHWKKKILPSQ